MDQDPTIRPLRIEDAPRVLDAFLLAEDMSRQGKVATLEDAQGYIEGLLVPTQWASAIVDEADQLLGLIVVTIDQNNHNGWFWYWAHPAGRGKGWTSRAAATVANWALTKGGLHRLELGHRANNPASQAVALNAGFIHEGTERERFLIDGERVDVLTYGRLNRDPIPETQPLAWQFGPPH